MEVAVWKLEEVLVVQLYVESLPVIAENKRCWSFNIVYSGKRSFMKVFDQLAIWMHIYHYESNENSSESKFYLFMT